MAGSKQPEFGPRLIELDEYDDGQVNKRQRITHPVSKDTIEKPLVTRRALPSDAFIVNPTRVQWIENESLPKRQTHAESVYVNALDSRSHQQHPEVPDRPLTSSGVFHDRRPLVRYKEVVHTDLPLHNTHYEVPRRLDGDSGEHTYRNSLSGRQEQGTQASLDSRYHRSIARPSESNHISSVDRYELFDSLHGLNRPSHFIHSVDHAPPGNGHQMIADPRRAHVVDPLTSRVQHPRFARALEDESSPLDINGSAQSPLDGVVRYHRDGGENLVGGQGYTYYQQKPRTELSSQKDHPSPGPLLSGLMQRSNLLSSEHRQVEIRGLQSPNYKAFDPAERRQTILPNSLNSPTEPMLIERVPGTSEWIPLRGEQRR